MLTPIKSLTLGLLACVAAACVSTSPSNPITVCDILAAPENFDGKRVSVRGVVDTDYFEFSGMTDAACFQRVVSLGPENQERGGGEELSAARQSVRNNPAARVEVTANGLIDWRPGQVPFLVVLEAQYTDIEVVPWTEPTQTR